LLLLTCTVRSGRGATRRAPGGLTKAILLDVLSYSLMPVSLPLLFVLLPSHVHTGQGRRGSLRGRLLCSSPTEPLGLGDSGGGDEPPHVAAIGGVRLEGVDLCVGVQLLWLGQVHPPAKDFVVDSDLVDRKTLCLRSGLRSLFCSVHGLDLPNKFVKGRPPPRETKLEVVFHTLDFRADMYHKRHGDLTKKVPILVSKKVNKVQKL